MFTGKAMFKIMAFTLSLSGLCSCLGARADEAGDRAVAFVEKLGGTVARDEKAPGKPVIEVSPSGTHVTDAGLKELRKALTKCKIVW